MKVRITIEDLVDGKMTKITDMSTCVHSGYVTPTEIIAWASGALNDITTFALSVEEALGEPEVAPQTPVTYKVSLVKVPEGKFFNNVIHEIHTLTGCTGSVANNGAHGVVDGFPFILHENATSDDVVKIKKVFESLGATIEID